MISAVVLAAGQSRRMGSNKLLLPLGGKPVISIIAEALQHGPVDKVLVVVGRQAEDVRAALAGHPVQFATNPDSNSDMLDSIRCGLRALSPSADAVLICLGDQPVISPHVITALIQAFRNGHPIVIPTWNGKRGHPLLIARQYWDEVLNGNYPAGLRDWLQTRANEVTCVPVDSSGILEDMDFPEDYQRIATTFREDTAAPSSDTEKGSQ